MTDLAKRYGLYLVRWQLSTPILAACVYLLTSSLGATWTTILANLIGGLIFFWVDLWIFRKTNILFTGELWEAKEGVVCADCGEPIPRGYRLVKAASYDKSRDRNPQFRCPRCSRRKYERFRQSQAPPGAPAGSP
jgi:DNA-directed RNA polymerase subunit RPC12/RpoP